MAQKMIYLGWIAYNNDPFKWSSSEAEWDDDKKRYVRDQQGNLITGPTISFLEESEFKGKISDIHLIAGPKPHSAEVSKLLKRELKKGINKAKVFFHNFNGEDITNHEELFQEMVRITKGLVSSLSSRCEILINMSPGPPAAQFVWLTLFSSAKPIWASHQVRLFQGIPKKYRSDGKVIREINFELPSLYNLTSAAFSRQREGIRGGGAEVDEMVASCSPSMIQCRDELLRLARTDFPVFILGERGVGKTTKAKQTLHDGHPTRRDQNFARVICGEQSDEGTKIQLFGCTKGYATDVEEQVGQIEHADGGTLFIDEVNDMSKELQRLLVAAIEDKTYRKLGSADRSNSDFRLVCASNLGIDELRKKLDRDFFDRISLLTVKIPPLRERREDLPKLWSDVLGKQVETHLLCPTEVRYLDDSNKLLHDWLAKGDLTGNFRTLQKLAAGVLFMSFNADKNICVVTEDIVKGAIERVEHESAPIAHTQKNCNCNPD